jgi:hypothetical protein
MPPDVYDPPAILLIEVRASGNRIECFDSEGTPLPWTKALALLEPNTADTTPEQRLARMVSSAVLAHLEHPERAGCIVMTRLPRAVAQAMKSNLP